MSAAVGRLSPEERESVCIGGGCDYFPYMQHGGDCLDHQAIVEQILTRHLAAFKAEAVAAIEAWQDNADRHSKHPDIEQATFSRSRARFLAYQRAARIVRDLNTT